MQTKSVSSLLREYFELEMAPNHPREFSIDTRSLPVVANTKSKWFTKESPERLCRTFVFKSRGEARAFVNELLDHEDGCKHHAEIKIQGSNVSIEVYTHDLDCVTSIDKEYANEAEAIYNDVCSYGYR